MRNAKITFFPVGNGDMTLVITESGRWLLIDANIRTAADDPDDATPDVARLLRERLSHDADGRLYVDALLVTHPDKDHCTGLRKHFHLGPPDTWSDSADKIIIREIWSSPMVFRRASRRNVLCDDARAFNAEARRRVRLYRAAGGAVADGDRILILGEDEDGRTEGLEAILVRVDQEFTRINGIEDESMTGRLLGPLPSDDGDDDETLTKNNSSTILRLSLAGAGLPDKCRLLIGGDAEVAIWERLWQRHESRSDRLSYDILLAPHHCSWHSLSYDSWSEHGEEAEVCGDACSALGRLATAPQSSPAAIPSRTMTTIRRASAPSASTRGSWMLQPDRSSASARNRRNRPPESWSLRLVATASAVAPRACPGPPSVDRVP